MYHSHVLHGQLLLPYYVTDANVAGGVAAGGLVVAVYALLLGVGAWRVHLRGRLCVYTNRSLNDLAGRHKGSAWKQHVEQPEALYAAAEART